MKCLFALFFISFFNKSHCQVDNYFSILNYENKLKTHVDSFVHITHIQNGLAYLNSDSLDLKNSYPKCFYDYDTRYSGKITSYLKEGSNDSLAILLFFYNNRFVEIAVLVKGSLYINNCEGYIHHNFMSSKIETSYSLASDSIIRSRDEVLSLQPMFVSKFIEGNNRNIEFEFFESFSDNVAVLSIRDKKAWSLIPNWCGINTKKNKLDHYLNK